MSSKILKIAPPLILIAVVLYVFVSFVLPRFSHTQKNYVAIPNSDAATSIQDILSNCPYNSTDKSGVAQPTDDNNLFYLSGQVTKINNNSVEVNTYCGLFLVSLTSDTIYISWNKKDGVNSTEQVSINDIRPEEQIYVHTKINEGKLIALDVQKVL